MTITEAQLNGISKYYHAFFPSDGSGFRRMARTLQSIWREEQALPPGKIRRNGSLKKIGSRIPMPMAETTLCNYLTKNIRIVVRKSLEAAAPDQVFAQPRIFNDLLSSQPLCFNLFGELVCDQDLAIRSFAKLLPGRVMQVTGIDFEFSPGRGQKEFTNDGTAFDVVVRFKNPEGGNGFIGIEIKYHENLKGKPAFHKKRYDEIAEQMGCFRRECHSKLRAQPLQQIWRDHLLAGVLLG
jgi:hypothetical protein